MKHVRIAVAGSIDEPIVFLLNPGVTARQILEQLRVEDDYVLFSEEDPARLFGHKDEIFSQVENGERLIGAVLADAAKAYRRSRLSP